MKDTITLEELRQTELYRKEQTRHLREFLEPKTLTDEEILEVFVENYGDDILPNIQASGIEFARAILRKAQENAPNNL